MTNPPQIGRPEIGTPQPLAQGVSCVLAPNPSPMTYWGTNTYLLGHDTLAVIDPGPADPAHLKALLAAIGTRRVSHILVTHSHLDHSPLARHLAQLTNAPVLAFGNSAAGRSPIMSELAKTGLMGGGEGVDHDFQPSACLADGDEVTGDGWTVTARHTPGHFGNHLSFQWGQDVFCGDLVMGWSTSLVSPPDGDLTDFMRSCRTMAALNLKRAYSGHGAPIEDVTARLTEVITHRSVREAQICTALHNGPQTAQALTRTIYTDVPPALHSMAKRNVLAHLIDLCSRAKATPQGPLSADAKFTLK